MKIQKDIVKRTIAIVGTMVLTFSTVASAEESRLTNSNGVITINTADGSVSIDADDIENNAQALEVLDGQLGGLSFKYEGGYYWAKAGTDGTWEKIGAVGIAAPWMVLKNAAGKDITFSSQSGVDIAGAMENYAGNKELLVTSEATLSNIGSTKYLSLEVPFTGYYTASGNALGASTTMLNYALPKLGDAVAANVLVGKYFTSSAGIRTEGSMADHSSDVTNKNSNVGYLPKNGANYLSVTVPYTGYYTNATKLITGIKYNPTGRVSQMPNKQTVNQNIGTANPNLASSVLKLGTNQSLTIPAGYYSNDIVIDNGVKDNGESTGYFNTVSLKVWTNDSNRTETLSYTTQRGTSFVCYREHFEPAADREGERSHYSIDVNVPSGMRVLRNSNGYTVVATNGIASTINFYCRGQGYCKGHFCVEVFEIG